jgi:hypothetical protein
MDSLPSVNSTEIEKIYPPVENVENVENAPNPKMKMKTYADYRTNIEHLYHGQQLCWLSGYEYRGRCQEAYCHWHPGRSGHYWTLTLDYGQLDNWPPFDRIFERALEQVGPTESDAIHDLWKAHETEFATSAKLHHARWRRWHGTGLSEPFVYALRDLLVERYAKARALYASWPIDLDHPYDFVIPSTDCADAIT